MYNAPSYGGAPPLSMPRHIGLGFAFAPLAIAVGSRAASGLFADKQPDHDPARVAAWGQTLANTGSGACAAGRAVREIAPGAHAPGDPGFRKGETIRFDITQIRDAIGSAPRGRPHDAPGTVEGLRTAIAQPNPEVAQFLTTDDALARIALGVAHGRLDCGVGWQEEPTVVHLRALIRDHKARPPPSVVETVYDAATNTVRQVTQGRGADGFASLASAGKGLAPIVLVGLGLGLVAAKLRGVL